MDMFLVLIPAILTTIISSVMTQQTSLPNVTFPDWYFQTEFDSSRLLVNFSCANSEMNVDLLFSEPFKGKVILEKAVGPLKECHFLGNGSLEYNFHVPLHGCGTSKARIPDELDQYTNSLTVLFDQSHLLEAGDLRKVLICRYQIPPSPSFIEIRKDDITGILNNASGLQWPRICILAFLLQVRIWLKPYL